jgi:multidrug efflux pump subunit AcrB
LPLGLSLDLVTHQPPIVAESVADATENLVQTIATVLAVVILFLGIRAGAIVGAIVPLSIVLALVGMALWGVPLHRISIAAVIIALGLLVDNGVVMAEDIKRRIDAGAASRDAALEASRTLAVPLLTSSLTTILAFTPLMLASDATGEFLRALAQVLMLTLLASWLLSVTITPLLCVAFLGRRSDAPPKSGPSRSETLYAGALRRVLGVRWLFLAGTVAVFAVSLAALGRVPTGLLPPSERAQFVLNLELPAGASEDETARVARRLAGFLADDAANPEVTGSVVYVGSGGPRFFLALAPVDPAPHVAFAVVNTAAASDVAPVRARVEAWMADSLPEARGWTELLFLGEQPPGTVEIRLSGGDVDALFAAGRAVESIFRDVEGARQIRTDWANSGPPAQRADRRGPGATRRRRALRSGAHPAGQVRRHPCHRLPRGRRHHPGRPPRAPEERASLDALADATVLSETGVAVPLLQIAELGGELQPWVIRRFQQERALTVSAVRPGMTAQALLETVAPRIDALDLPPGMRWTVDGEVAAKAKANGALVRDSAALHAWDRPDPDLAV